MHRSALFVIASAGVFGAWALAACGSNRETGFVEEDAGAEGGLSIPDGGFGSPDVDAGPPPPGETRDPVDCEEAKTTKSYVGCDYWPTVTPNMVWSIFDFAVVVANTGTKEANVHVTGPNAVDKQVTVPPGELRKIFLPWVPTLKGPDIDECMSKVPTLEGSVVVPNGAYHLVSSSPVIVYQFNALEYENTGGEGPDGGPKDWSTCPGLSCSPNPFPCLSFTNDASLLLPSTAMTTNYRVTGYAGFPGGNPNGTSSALSVTATEPNTTVRLALSPTVSVMGAPPLQDAGVDPDAGDASVPDASVPDAGPSAPTVPATSAGLITVVLENAGDVIEFVADKSKDFSGSLVQSDKPVQVISSDPCMSIPFGKSACDHLEETVLPAETLGKHYLVATPTGPKGTSVGHVVRFYGNQNGTKLKYTPSKPTACPLSLSAGQVVDCNVVDTSFEVTADKEFAVTSFLLASELYGKEQLGDPSQTNVASVEQYRTKYVFLAPTDYPVRWADVIAPKGADIILDGKPIDAAVSPIAGDYQIHRVDLTKSGKDGAHTLTSNEPVGVQVIGFGRATSFQYPAGLNLGLIAPPPVPK